MLKIIITVVVSVAIGIGLGRLQSSIANNAYEERFGGTRLTEAEIQGEVTSAEMEGSAKVEVLGGTEFQFGMMQHGDTMSHEFPFRNTGDGPLTLEMGKSTCKCTVGDLESSVLKPGKETMVKLTWTAQSIMKDFGQSALIITNDPFQAEVKLTIRGQIADSFVIEPPELSLGSISVNEEVTRTFHVFTYLDRSKDLSEFEWTHAQTENLVKIAPEKIEFDRAKFPDHKNASGVHKVTVNIQPGLPIGPLGAQIQFSTDQGEDVGFLGVPVSAKVIGELELFGGSSFDARLNVVKMGKVPSEEGASVTIWLAIHGEQREDVVPEIKSIVPEEALTVTIGEPRKDARRIRYPLRFEVPKGAPEVYYPGNSNTSYAKVVLKTNHEVTQELPINVRLIVTK